MESYGEGSTPVYADHEENHYELTQAVEIVCQMVGDGKTQSEIREYVSRLTSSWTPKKRGVLQGYFHFMLHPVDKACSPEDFKEFGE